MIESLTQEQIDKFPVYVDKWVTRGLNTDPCKFDKCKPVLKKVYTVAGIDVPKFVIGPINSQYEGGIVEKILKRYVDEKIDFKSAKDLNKKVMSELSQILDSGERQPVSIFNQIYGCQEYWLSYYDYFQIECNLDLKEIDPLVALTKLVGWWTPLKNVSILQHRPLEIHRDEQHELHNLNGPAVKYRGCENSTKYSNIYAVHGVRVPKKVVELDYDVKDIDSEKNAEVRRVMIELYGQAKYILDSNAKEIHSDEFGTLYQKELAEDEPMMMVKVVNSTQEPDGTFKDYWIRVDPKAYGGIKTARAAVASTWRNEDGSFIFASPEEYDCDIET